MLWVFPSPVLGMVSRAGGFLGRCYVWLLSHLFCGPAGVNVVFDHLVNHLCEVVPDKIQDK